jgi:RNA polymerase sigma factor (sigma-70 family)
VSSDRERGSEARPLPDLRRFADFYDAHRDRVHRFLLQALGPDDAEDCLQETFLSAFRAFPRLEPGANQRAWILTIAHRKAIDTYRTRHRLPRAVPEVPESSVEVWTPSAGADLATEDTSTMWGQVGGLPPKQRTALYLRFARDLPYADVGAAMGCSPESARRSVHEGLKKLRARRHRVKVA